VIANQPALQQPELHYPESPELIPETQGEEMEVDLTPQPTGEARWEPTGEATGEATGEVTGVPTGESGCEAQQSRDSGCPASDEGCAMETESVAPLHLPLPLCILHLP
jgi:hypothetical protein